MQAVRTPTYRRPSLGIAIPWPVVIPFALYLLQALLLAGWIVDDAGISFAYARNLGLGHGLVSQPGVPPVEGYSNPLWVFLLAPCFRLHLFHVLLTPKLLSLLFVLVAYFALYRTFRAAGSRGALLPAAALGMLSLSTPFVVWTMSGLENGLYAALLALFAWQSVLELERPTLSFARGALLGALAAGLALTRPEAVLYLAAWPLLLLTRGRRPSRLAGRSLLGFALVVVALYGGYLLFRWIHFGALVPNTYYAKGAAYFGQALEMTPVAPFWTRLPDLLMGTLGPLGPLALLWVPLALVLWKRRGGLPTPVVVLGLLLALSVTAYLLLPADWMNEYRFATPFVTLAWPFLALLTAPLIAARRRLALSLIGVACGLAALTFVARTLRFASEPTVPFGAVAGQAEQFNSYARLLGEPHPSLLVPDVGGNLYYSRLRIYDLGMLCDPVIARTLGRDDRALHDYVFGKVKPTFIHVHGVWRERARLEADPRLARDYIALWPEWGGSQDYVRKEALRNREDLLVRMQRE